MSKIERLTQEQIARFPEFVERWTKIGLCTDPADREQAERAIRMMYEAARLPPPAKIVWCGSPLSQALTRAIILDKRMMASVRASVGESVRASVGESVRASVWDSVWESVWESVWDSVRASVWDSVGDSVRESVWDSVRESVWDSVRESVYGQHDAGWLSFYHYFHDVVSLQEQTKKLGGLWLLAQSAGWALPHKNICWVSERHNILRRDDRGRLHDASGPAVAFPDGWKIYAWHGIRVPAWCIEDQTKITKETILAEGNTEIRRAMCEIVGWPRALEMLGGKTIHTDECLGLPRKLIELDLKGERVRLLLMTNGTIENGERRQFVEGVPATINTCHEAVAWQCGVPAKFHREGVRT